jgi:hypothetical protein
MEDGEALAAFVISFVGALAVLGLCTACLRGCATIVRNSRVPPAPPPLPVYFHQQSRKPRDPRVISHPGGEASVGILLQK